MSFLIDTHAHISYYEKSEQIEVIKKAFDNNVKLILNISTEVEKFQSILDSINGFKNIYNTIGTHPCHVQDEPHIEKNHLLDIIKQHKSVIGIGETGLDYYHSIEYKSLQIEKFWNHIEIAGECNMPIIIHTRNANDDTLQILKDARKKFSNLKIIIHCFTGDLTFCKKLLDLNCYISYSGIVTFKNAKDIQESMLFTPINRLLIETDSPFLAPEPHRGKKNEPAFVKYVAEFIANKKNVDVLQLQKIVFENFSLLFGLKISN